VSATRRRVAALAGERRGVRATRLHRLLADADLGMTPQSALRRLCSIAAGAVAAGAMFAGLQGALAAPILAALAGAAWLRRRAKGRLDRLATAFPDAVRSMADGLRSGMNLRQAIGLAAGEAARPLDAELAAVIHENDVGVPLDEALTSFCERCPVPGADLMALTTSVAARTGADLAPILDGIVEAARDRERLRRELRAATAQGRLTAAVVGALPFAFLLVLGAGARGEVHVLLHEPIGWALLAAGGTLEAVGFLWIRRMVAS